MTFSLQRIVGVLAVYNAGGDQRPGAFDRRRGWFGTREPFYGSDWSEGAEYWYNVLWGAHANHLLEFLAAALCYVLFWQDGTWLKEAQEWKASWVLPIIAYTFTCGFVLTSFWHHMTYASSGISRALKPFKFNPANQYEPGDGQVGRFSSSSGQLQREVYYSTLGWLQASFWQCLFMHAWARGWLSTYTSFWQWPVYSVLSVAAVTLWREIHFYWAHRSMHPWFDRERGLLDGDVGAFLYRHFHSLHHKSYNPGPWAGLCMHPVEHLLYYSCATLPPLLMSVHPLAFLYCVWHATLSVLGGHDGHEEPAGGSACHWLHHAKFECNYGVPFPINFDKMFGTWLDYAEYKEQASRRAAGKAAAKSE